VEFCHLFRRYGRLGEPVRRKQGRCQKYREKNRQPVATPKR